MQMTVILYGARKEFPAMPDIHLSAFLREFTVAIPHVGAGGACSQLLAARRDSPPERGGGGIAMFVMCNGMLSLYIFQCAVVCMLFTAGILQKVHVFIDSRQSPV